MQPPDVLGVVFVSRTLQNPGAAADALEDALGLRRDTHGTDPIVFSFPNGDLLALHRSSSPGEHGTIIGFLVDDVDTTVAWLSLQSDVELLGGVFTGPNYRWQHFRAADGEIWEVLDRRGTGVPEA